MFCTHVASITHPFCKSQPTINLREIHEKKNDCSVKFFLCRTTIHFHYYCMNNICRQDATRMVSLFHNQHIYAPPVLHGFYEPSNAFQMISCVSWISCDAPLFFVLLGLYYILIFYFANISQYCKSKTLRKINMYAVFVHMLHHYSHLHKLELLI